MEDGVVSVFGDMGPDRVAQSHRLFIPISRCPKLRRPGRDCLRFLR